MIPWLLEGEPFPPVEYALDEPNGLLAAGGDLAAERLLEAYARGIFPWFSEGDPILWWSPDPRMVLLPQEFSPSRSLRKRLRQGGFEVRADTRFREVMEACAAPRRDQAGTWIGPRMVDAYCRLHELGHAHSIETWMEGRLAGGLYGVALGRAFFGESMFARETDASKIAFATLVAQLRRWQFGLIDCQLHTGHLASLGAREVARARFTSALRELIHLPAPPGKWRLDHDLSQ